MRQLLLLLPFVLVACGGAKTAMEPVPTDHEGGRPSADGADERTEIMRLFMEATQARLGGQLPKAVSLYQQCLKADPQNAASMFELAKLYHASQQFEPAVAMAKQAVETIRVVCLALDDLVTTRLKELKQQSAASQPQGAA